MKNASILKNMVDLRLYCHFVCSFTSLSSHIYRQVAALVGHYTVFSSYNIILYESLIQY